MDNKDLKILEQLKKDSRMTVKNIAKKTSLRPSTVHKRILNLKAKKTIRQFSIVVDDKEIGENFIVFMMVKTRPSVLLDESFLSSKHIKEVYGITGEYDIIMKLKFKDVEEFNLFLIKFRREQKVDDTVTFVCTARIKE